MSENLFYSLQIASTLSVLPAMVLSLFQVKKNDLKLNAFSALLLIGFIVDLFGWYSFLTKNGSINTYVRDVYSLIEALILFWLVSSVTENRILKYVLKNAWIFLIPVWCVGIIHKDIIVVCRTTSKVLLAFASCFCLLKLVEADVRVSQNPIFWILLGIFFYFFCSFFFVSLLATQLDVKVWYLHNIINIIANLIYFYGFLRMRESMVS